MRVTEHSIILEDSSPHTGGPYEIDFDRCDTPIKILDWVRQLCQKQWVTREQIGYFILHTTSRHNITMPE